VHTAAELIGIDGYRGGWLVVPSDAALLALRFTEALDTLLAQGVTQVIRDGAWPP
jgi:hypothetical protein